MRPIRLFEEDKLYFITNRTIQGRLLMRPSPLLNQIIGAMIDWRAKFWGRRYSAEPILDDDALEIQIKQELVYVGPPEIFTNDFSLDNINWHLYTFLFNFFLFLICSHK
jgi:hypothetical protein